MPKTSGSPSGSPPEPLRGFMSHRPFSQMLARLNVDLARPWWRGLDGLIFRALRNCATCPRISDCRFWLAQEHAGELSPDFCRNAGPIAACRILAAEPKGDPNLAGEPSLAEMLGDQGVQQIMASDHVARGTIEELLKRKS
jgi:Family of unknown function (DUF6455)